MVNSCIWFLYARTKGDEGDDDDDDEGAVEGPVGKLPNPSGRIMSTWFLQDVNWKLPKLNVMITLDTIQVRWWISWGIV